MKETAEASDIDIYPASMLETMHSDQKRVLEAWGIQIPDDEELFEKDTPLSVKVRFFDLMIREAMEAEFV